MMKNTFIFFLFVYVSSFSQINTQGVLSNENALLIAKKDGYQTINIPILSRYKGITSNQAKILNKLKLNSILEYTVVDPVNKIIDTKITYVGNDYIAAQTQQGNLIRTYLAVALVEVDKVNEVRQHQIKNNAQTVDYQFVVLNNSKVGKALSWFKEGQTITHTVDFINTSNGWKKDIEDRSDVSITNYTSSKYGKTGLSNYKSKLKDIEFIKDIRTTIVGRWDRSTDKEKNREHYIFKNDGTFENYYAKKDETIKGKFKFSTNLGDKIYISLIPREGRNKSKSLQRSRWGMYIDGIPFRKEGSSTSSTITSEDKGKAAEVLNKRLEIQKRLYGSRLLGFWKSSNGKTTLDIKEGKKLDFKEKKKEYSNATYDLTILEGKLLMVIFDEDLVEIFNEELKVVRTDQMRLGSNVYTKF